MVEKEAKVIGEFGWCQRLLARPNVETGAEAQRELVEPELFGAPNFGCCWST